jgi:hypothetical protein
LRTRAAKPARARPNAAIFAWQLGSRFSGSTTEDDMQTIHAGYRGLSLLVNLNWDKLFYVGTLVVALLAGALIGSLAIGL